MKDSRSRNEPSCLGCNKYQTRTASASNCSGQKNRTQRVTRGTRSKHTAVVKPARSKNEAAMLLSFSNCSFLERSDRSCCGCTVLSTVEVKTGMDSPSVKKMVSRAYPGECCRSAFVVMSGLDASQSLASRLPFC